MDQEEQNCAMCHNFETAAMQSVGHPPIIHVAAS
jgi:cytochrome c2